MSIVKLNSVGSAIDTADGYVYPVCLDGRPDLTCGVDVRDEPASDDWTEMLSPADAATVGRIIWVLNTRETGR